MLLPHLAVQKVEEGASQASVASMLNVHRNTVGKYVRLAKAQQVSAEEAGRAAELVGELVGEPGGLSVSGTSVLHEGEAVSPSQLASLFGSPGRTVQQERGEATAEVSAEKNAWTTHDGRKLKSVQGYWFPHPLPNEAAVATLLSFATGSLPPPVPKQRGGAREACTKLSHQHRVYLAQVLHSTGLSLSDAAAYVRSNVDASFPSVSAATLSDAAARMGVERRASQRVDPGREKGSARREEVASFVAERDRGVEGAFRGDNLLFVDETNFHLNDVAPAAKSYSGRREVEKGTTPYVNVVAAMGIMSPAPPPTETRFLDDPLERILAWKARAARGEAYGGWNVRLGEAGEDGLPLRLCLFWHIVPPQKQVVLSPSFGEEEPLVREQVAFVTRHASQTRRALAAPSTAENAAFLSKLLFFLGVEDREVTTDGRLGGRASDAEIVERVRLATEGRRAGLPRKFFAQSRLDRGGGLQSPLSSTPHFLRFLEDLRAYVRFHFGEGVLQDARVAVDNASTHGAVRVDAGSASFVHEWARERGFQVLFLPVRSPKYNPIEVLFAYAKQVTRSYPFPAAGAHSVEGMVSLVDRALRQVTPSMATAWIACRGYQFHPSVDLPLGVFMHREGDVFVNRKHAWQRGYLRGTETVSGTVPQIAYCSRQREERDALSAEVAAEVEGRRERLRSLARRVREAREGEGEEAPAALLAALRAALPLYAATWKAAEGKPLAYLASVAAQAVQHADRELGRCLARREGEKLCSFGVASACGAGAAAGADECARGAPSGTRSATCVNERGTVVRTYERRPAAAAYDLFTRRGRLAPVVERVARQLERKEVVRGVSLSAEEGEALAPFFAYLNRRVEGGELRVAAPLFLRQDEGGVRVRLVDEREWREEEGGGGGGGGGPPLVLEEEGGGLLCRGCTLARVEARNVPGLRVRLSSGKVLVHGGRGGTVQLVWSLLQNPSPEYRLSDEAVSLFDAARRRVEERVVQPAWKEEGKGHLSERMEDALRERVVSLVPSVRDGTLLGDEAEPLPEAVDAPSSLFALYVGRLRTLLARGHLSPGRDVATTERRLLRLLAETRFPPASLLAAERTLSARVQGKVPLFTERTAPLGASPSERRWPGYPVSTYPALLSDVRDVYWEREADPSAFALFEAASPFYVFVAYALEEWASLSDADFAVYSSSWLRELRLPSPTSVAADWASRSRQWNLAMEAAFAAPRLDAEEGQFLLVPCLLLAGKAELEAGVEAGLAALFPRQEYGRRPMVGDTARLAAQVAPLLEGGEATDWVVAEVQARRGQPRRNVPFSVAVRAGTRLHLPASFHREEGYARAGMPWEFVERATRRVAREQRSLRYVPLSLLSHEEAEADPAAVRALLSLYEAQVGDMEAEDGKQRTALRSSVASFADSRTLSSLVERVAALQAPFFPTSERELATLVFSKGEGEADVIERGSPLLEEAWLSELHRLLERRARERESAKRARETSADGVGRPASRPSRPRAGSPATEAAFPAMVVDRRGRRFDAFLFREVEADPPYAVYVCGKRVGVGDREREVVSLLPSPILVSRDRRVRGYPFPCGAGDANLRVGEARQLEGRVVGDGNRVEWGGKGVYFVFLEREKRGSWTLSREEASRFG